MDDRERESAGSAPGCVRKLGTPDVERRAASSERALQQETAMQKDT